MTDMQIEELNSALPEVAKIRWHAGRGWTSGLWLKMSAQGWQSTQSSSGLRRLYDANQNFRKVYVSRVAMLAGLTEFIGEVQ